MVYKKDIGVSLDLEDISDVKDVCSTISGFLLMTSLTTEQFI